MPAGQAKQVFADVAPVAALYLPASQTVQRIDPIDEAYDPAPHNPQPIPLDEEYPAGHGEQEFEEKQENPASHVTVQIPEQTLDTVAPTAVLYLPAPHIVHFESASWDDDKVAVSTRYVPAGQAMQVLANIAPVVALYLPVSHIKHFESASWDDAKVPTSIRYVPAGQAAQVLADDAPVAALYVPAPHTVH